MNLQDFLDSCFRSTWICEPGLDYYVRKSILYPGVIELVNCVQPPAPVVGAYFRFLKRYESRVAFYADTVVNDGLVKLYRQRKWLEWDVGDCSHFASPLMVELCSHLPIFQKRFGILSNNGDR